ncbi:helix-turn-helix transcriptional regulator [Cohnella zeiphila]|uniref:Helix-turn-helix transcriptional regulator n=1 Tax=Cohnella zeiphila TaxID=2761120 RepID=A0A7X0ST94_9BACL|nr:AraC family transcriptional regulator [Cohnella zeiphila]MBB6735581.1 helix-turn-helix transcriptional regulator [Cohnella zeiphila]
MFQFISPPLPHFILCGEDTYPIGGKHADRSGIGVFDLLLVTRGCLHIAEENVPLTIGPGSFALFRPDRAHRTTEPCREETHFYWAHFQTLGLWGEAESEEPAGGSGPEETYRAMDQFAIYLPRSGTLPSPEPAFAQLRQLSAMQEDSSAPSHWRRQLLFQELLLRLREETKLPPGSSYLTIADEAAAFLRRNYKAAFTYRKMSDALHFHANYISLCMKRVYGCTPLDYLTRYRVEQAKRLLIDTNEAVGRIAEESGFGSFPYFVRCFGRLAGMTPAAFRKQFRER